MSDGITTIIGNDERFGGKTPEELESILDVLTGSAPAPTEAPPDPTPAEEAPAVEETSPPAEAEPTPEPEPEPSPEGGEEIDLHASELEGERIRREKLEAELAQQRAHASRLAGEIGYLRKLAESRPQASEPYEPQSPQDEDRLAQVQRELSEVRNRQTQADVAQVVQEAFARLDASVTPEIGAEIKEISPQFQEELADTLKMTDPKLARQSAEAIGRRAIAEARERLWEKNHKLLVERKASTAPKRLAEKKSAAITGAGAVSTPPPKPKSLADMTAAEADAWLRSNVQ